MDNFDSNPAGTNGLLDNFIIRYIFAFLAFIFSIFGIPFNIGGDPKPSDPAIYTAGMHMRAVEVNGQLRKYQIFVPQNYTPDKKWPLIVFLSGAGERGDDGVLQTKVGIGTFLRDNPGGFPCLVLLVQAPQLLSWEDAPEYWEVPYDDVLRLYSVDEDRISLTGLSMGGNSVWTMGAKYPDRWSALMPVASRVDFALADQVKHFPIFVFHGAQDPIHPVGPVRVMVQMLLDRGAQVYYQEWGAAYHNVWDYTYSNHTYMDWLIGQNRQDRMAQP